MNDEQRCKHCRHWGQWDLYGFCKVISDPDTHVPDGQASMAWVAGLDSWLITYPDFGCIMFEAKP